MRSIAKDLARAIDAADGLAITFHRAFDETRDLQEALDVLLGFDAVTNVLTSGGKPSVLQAEVDNARAGAASVRLTLHCAGGSGFDGRCRRRLRERDASVKAVHFGSGVRVGGNGLAPVDAKKVAHVRALLDA